MTAYGELMANIGELRAWIEPEVEALGFEVVRVTMLGGTSDPTLQVMAERPETGQLNLDDCGTISRRLSDILDEKDPIEHEYRLEVSSPGIDRPLTRPKDYQNWVGHRARIRLSEAQDGRKQFEGALTGHDGETVGIDVPNLGETRVPLAIIHSAKLILTDELIKATTPLSTEGADSIQEER